METFDIVWIVAVVAVSSLAQSLAGFGFGLLAVPMMTLVVVPHDSVVVATLIGTVSTTVQAVIDRRLCDSHQARTLALAAYAGMPFGLLVFTVVSEGVMRIVLGVVVLVATVVLARGFVLHKKSRVLAVMMGWLSGVLSTSTSTNGPPLVFYLQAQGLDAATFRATINRVFAYSNVGAIAFFSASGHLSLDGLVAAVISLPALFLSLRIGYALRPYIRADVFRVLVLVLLALSGVSVISSAFL